MPSTIDQAELVEALRRGDGAAFEYLLREQGPRLLALARRFLPEEADARDAFQDAMLAAFRSVPDFDGKSAITTWLHRIVVNACLMKLRSRRRRPQRSLDDLLPRYEGDGHARELSSAWHATEASLTAAQAARVRDSLDELPDPQRTVLLLRDVQGLSTEEAAAVLGISTNAAKTRLHRARQALRELLAPHFREVGR